MAQVKSMKESPEDWSVDAGRECIFVSISGLMSSKVHMSLELLVATVWLNGEQSKQR